MQCTKCGTSNREGIKFCEECGTRLGLVCPSCGTHILVGKKFCGECGTALTTATIPFSNAQPASPVLPAQPQILHPHPPLQNSQSPIDCTPNYLADRILSGKAALEGERKIVTVLFTDIRGSMDIMESLDSEEAKQLLDPCLQLMMRAVYRFEGTVNRILGDGIMALFGAPLALEDHPHIPSVPRMPRSICMTLSTGMPSRYAKVTVSRYKYGLGLILVRLWFERLAMTCAWTIPQSVTPLAWLPVWSRWPLLERPWSPPIPIAWSTIRFSWQPKDQSKSKVCLPHSKRMNSSPPMPHIRVWRRVPHRVYPL